ncbi:hypothetical protein MKY37_02375 [Psychrobacillus sp. FSL K6-2836]|uniref:hypothetical protein n=1 Tax=Psychrobacillus sp. FSL K6-2836 TaxID=2921548 RepID=UPI0030F7507B
MLNAGLSFSAMIPVAGWVSTGGKFVIKGSDLYSSRNVLSTEKVESIYSPIYQDVVNSPLSRTQYQLDTLYKTHSQLNTPYTLMFNLPSAKTDIPTTIKSGDAEVNTGIKNVEAKGTGNGKTNVYSVEDFLNEINSLPHAKLSKEVTDGTISTTKGNRPLPQVYMTKKEISSHLALFDEGAVKIQSSESYEQATKLYGSNIGDPKTGTYVLPKNVVDKAVEASNGNPRVLEELLGLEKGFRRKTHNVKD